MPTELHPDFPIVSGDYPLTAQWRLRLPEQFNRRIEDGSMVLWRPELTFWINVWNNDRQASVDELLDAILKSAHPKRRAEVVERGGAVARLTYELAEEDAQDAGSMQESVNGYIFAASGYVQISGYYDTPEAGAMARQAIASVAPAQ